MTQGLSLCHVCPSVMGKKVEPPREERRQGKKGVERVHSERCRDADILSVVACGA